MIDTKKYYRSIQTEQHDAEFNTLLKREFPGMEPEKLDGFSRRRFLQLLGASSALAAASGCVRWEEQKILTFNERPKNRTPGVPQHFATAMEIGGVAAPLLMTVFDGRPIKTEGNPEHPMSEGAASAFSQASLLTLYDPDRSTTAVRTDGDATANLSFDDFAGENRELFMSLRRNRGEGFRVLAESSSSPSLAGMKQRLLKAMPKARWHEWEPITDDNSREGSRLAFGKPYRTFFDFEKADVILSLDCDLLGSHPGSLRQTRGFSRRRDPDNGKMNRLYVVESNHTVTGAAADNRLPLRSGLMSDFLTDLESELGVEGVTGSTTAKNNPRVHEFVIALAADLKVNRGTSIITAGSGQPAEVHARVHRLNAWLDNAGQTVQYGAEADPDRDSHLASIKDLTDSMNNGEVETLLILGGNPVYNAPADLSFADALPKVKNTIHLALYRDETSILCGYHVPMAHFLETWGDALAWDGSLIVTQPTIAPLHGGKSSLEMLAAVTIDEFTDGYDIVRRTFDTAITTDEQAWRKTVHDGALAGSAWKLETPKVGELPASSGTNEVSATDELENGKLEICFASDSCVYDGRFANNGWLQELPDFMTKTTWDNCALIAPSTAGSLGIETGDLVVLEFNDTELEMVAYVMPGHAPGSVTVALGYGRTAAGVVGGSVIEDVAPVGFDTYRLRSSDSLFMGTGLSLNKIGIKYPLAMTQEHFQIDTVGMEGREERLELLVRETDVDHYRKDPDFVQEFDHGPPLKSLWESFKYEGRRWGMSIDLTKCTSCNACVTACQAENNIPVVGKERVLEGREMHWIRIDRYFSGDASDPSVMNQPLPCQQCENAPCEEVCPVGATMHSDEGLNDMVYNRCVGTRYCSNNCPYKVRRFNWFNFHMDIEEPENEVLKMVYNPEVTVRARGVMEKCTYCIQRIARVRIQANNEKRDIRDGEVVPACAQTCAAEAITFGDLNDKSAEVTEQHANPRAYSLLAMLNVKPRTAYLARITNPNPALTKMAESSAH